MSNHPTPEMEELVHNFIMLEAEFVSMKHRQDELRRRLDALERNLARVVSRQPEKTTLKLVSPLRP